jgi:hypothetical protein
VVSEFLVSIQEGEELMLGYTARLCPLELVLKLINIFFWSTRNDGVLTEWDLM